MKTFKIEDGVVRGTGFVVLDVSFEIDVYDIDWKLKGKALDVDDFLDKIKDRVAEKTIKHIKSQSSGGYLGGGVHGMECNECKLLEIEIDVEVETEDEE